MKRNNIFFYLFLALSFSCEKSDESDIPPVGNQLSIVLDVKRINLNPLTYEFTVDPNVDDDEIKEINWDFGDGENKTTQLKVEHIYSDPGLFNMHVEVINKEGKTATASYTVAYNAATFDFDETVTFQTMEGFGGFGAEKVWWSQGPWYTENYLNRIVDEMGSTIIRTQIYWDGETVNDNDDPYTISWDGFDFGPDSDNGKQFDFIKALDERDVKIFATVWSPPVWMKLFDDPKRIPSECYNCSCPVTSPYPENRKMCGGRLNPRYYDEFAEYLVAYIKTVKEVTGADIYALSIQNEPVFANPFESNVVLPEEYADILRVVGHRFESEGINTRLFGPEHMGEYSWGNNIEYVNEILKDPSVAEYLSFYAVHSYVDGVDADYGSAEGWASLHQLITIDNNRQLWMTETSDGSISGWELANKMSKSLYLALKFGQISGWVYWAYADVAIQNGTLTKLGHVFKNFYKNIESGALMVQSNSNSQQLLSLSFYHPIRGKLTHILINNTDSDLGIYIPDHASLNEYTGMLTSPLINSEEIFNIQAGDLYTIPAEAVLTLHTN